MKEGVFYIFITIFLWPLTLFANNTPIPIVDFNYQVKVGQEVTLDASQSLDIDNDELLFIWDFGDGLQGQGIIASHIYEFIGSYNIILTISDGYDVSMTSFVINIVEEDSNSDQNNAGDNSDSGQVVNYSDDIVLNELMPNPAGSDNYEWIELFNPSNISVDLAGWVIRDASGKTYTIDSDDFVNTFIVAHDYFVIPRSISGIALNNTGETVELLNPNVKLVHSTQYDTSAGNDITWALDNSGAWQWTLEGTKGEKNIIKTKAIDDISTVDNVQGTASLVDNAQGITLLLDVATSTNINTSMQYATSGDIFITELLPAPAGDDRKNEFIEIYNNSDFIVDLEDWRIFDLKTDYIFKNTIINPSEYLLLERNKTKIALNNTGDTITLADADDNIIDVVEYAKASNNKSYVNSLTSSTNWFWTDDITPGDTYLGLDVDSEIKVLGFSEENIDENNNINFVESISEIYNYDTEIDKEVIVQGSITAAPGQIDKKMIYIADQSGGIQIYMHSSDWPELEVGDIVEITGIVSQAYGEYRIKIKDQTNIKFITIDNILEPILLCKFISFDIGSYVEIPGKITKKHKPYIDIETNCEDRVVEVIKLKLNDSLYSELERDDIINTKGIIRIRNDSLFIQVLDSEILELKDTVDDDEVGLDEKKLLDNSNPKNVIITADNMSKSDIFSLNFLDSLKSRLYAIILLMISFVSIILYIKKKKL